MPEFGFAFPEEEFVFKAERAVVGFEMAESFFREEADRGKARHAGQRLKHARFVGMAGGIDGGKAAGNARRKGVAEGKHTKAAPGHERTITGARARA